jgi:hypothetical protein
VKLAGFLLVVASLAWAASPPTNQHGTRVVPAQTTYLVEPEGIPPGELTPERLRTLVQFRGAGSEGVRVAVGPDGRTLLLPPPDAPTPSAVFETWVEQLPSDYMESITAGFSSVDREENKIVARRFVRDNFLHVYASYAVTVEMLAEMGKYRATFSVSPRENDVKLPASEEWKVVAPSQFPVPQVLDEGETIRVELYQDARSGQQIVEYLHVGKQSSIAMRKEAAHDSYAEDAQFAFTQPHLKANGTPFDPALLPDTLSGPVVWAYVPGFGRYVLSFLPHPEQGFDLAGEVAGNSLIFTVAGNMIRVDCADRIASGSGTYNVYALLDSAWQPADAEDQSRFVMGSAPGVQ